MEDELFDRLYPLIIQEHNRRARRKRVQYSDAIVLLVAMWAVLHDRPISWACQVGNWHGRCPWFALPSEATMSRRLRTLSVQLLLEQMLLRLLSSASVAGFCLCRRIDSKPLPVGGFSKDRDARRGYATGGMCRGYKLFCCWSGRCAAVPEVLVLGSMNTSDQAGAMALIARLDRLWCGGACGYLAADPTHDTNVLHEFAGTHGLLLLAPRKEPAAALGHRDHSRFRLRSIQLLEPPRLPLACPLPSLGPELYHLRGQIERDYGNLGSFGGGLQPLPAWVRRPRRVALWVIIKLIINGMRICQNHAVKA